MTSPADRKVGSDVLTSIVSTVEALSPAAGDIAALVAGLIQLVPSAIALVKDVIADIEGKSTVPAGPVLPQVQAEMQSTAAALDTPIGPSVGA